MRSVSGKLSNDSRLQSANIRISKLAHCSMAFLISGVNLPILMPERFSSTILSIWPAFLIASWIYLMADISKNIISKY